VTTWQLAEAKARLSELIERSRKEGPPEITRHGRRVAVVVAADTWDRRVARRGSACPRPRRRPWR
jgi:prevent-host-death family protein